jgi:hypothetical protein
MNRRSFLTTLAAPALAGAQATEIGFTSLFDGKTLNGWSVREGPESAFFVEKGDIVVTDSANFPTWLRTDRQYENFDFRCEFFVKGWIDSGIYIHAPEHGRNTETGMKINIFHKQDTKMLPESMGSIFPLVPPLKVTVKNRGEWNSMRILMDWPQLRVWVNDEIVQDLDVESVPDLKYRLRTGYIGLESLSYPIRFRNLRVKELPPKDRWEPLYEGPSDFAKWEVNDGKALWTTLGGVLRSDGLGHLRTKEEYRDFKLQLYIRASRHSNGGVLFRAKGSGAEKHYEIQIHDVEGAVYPTGSLYGYKRSIYPKISPEEWFLMQMVVKDSYCLVRINGENVCEYSNMELLDPGHIMLQAHQTGRWLEYKHIRLQRI